MVHVKEYGQKPGDRKFESRCKTCGSIIAFTESEAENRTGPRPDDNLLVVKCPVCKGEVYGYPST